jgi:hypothetical protein
MVGGFSEPLFILFEVLLLIALLRRWWLPAALCVAAMAGTRLVGVIGFVWLLGAWYAATPAAVRLVRAPVLALLGMVASLGVVLDAYVKYRATGHWMATLQIRDAWGAKTILNAWHELSASRLAAGDYETVLLAVAAVFLYCVYALYRALRERVGEAVLLLTAGVSMVGLTWLLNPEIHSSGRYSLPLLPAIIGALAVPSLRTTSLAVLCVAMAAGGSVVGLNAMRFYQQLPPF